MESPLNQFLIKPLIPIVIGGVDFSFTNASLFMGLITLFLLGVQHLALRRQTLIPGYLQSIYEVSYGFVTKMAKDNAGEAAKPYFPFIFCLFTFILCANMFGMIPYGFTITSHIIVTLTLAMIVFLSVTFLGFYRHGWRYFRVFCPSGLPLAVAPLVIIVELISYLMRPITLALRLFVNMMAGHMILKLFGAFTVMMGVFGFLPLTFVLGMTAFEFFIAGLQAYVFTILTCVYLNDALHLH